MKIALTTERQMIDRIETALDYTQQLDKVPFYLKREAAEIAARHAAEFLRGIDVKGCPSRFADAT